MRLEEINLRVRGDTKMKAAVKSALNFMLDLANDNSHGYSQDSRWGPDYDCSSAIIAAYEQAGIPVKSNGATYTGNMRSVFLKTGFKDVTNQVNLNTGYDMLSGDVLLNEAHHTAMVVVDGGSTIVHASINEKGTVTGGKSGDQTGKEICTRSYYNKPWNCVLRYVGDDVKVETKAYIAVGRANVNTSLNVRSAPNTSSTKIGEFAPNDVIYITGKCSNGWYCCLVSGGIAGYVSGDYVADIKDESIIKPDEETLPKNQNGEKIYNTVDEVDEWAREAVQWCVNNRIVIGTGEGLGLNDEKVWQCVTMWRLARLMKQ